MKKLLVILMISMGLVFSVTSAALALPPSQVEIGPGADASGVDAVAIGKDANASGDNSVALGAGSVANEDNTVSVGDKGSERRITNVAPGVKTTDAVNVGQLNKVKSSVSNQEDDIDDLEDRMGTAETNIDDLNTRVTNNTNDINTLNENMDTANTKIDDLDGRVTENTTNITNLQDQVEENTSDIITNQNDITQIQEHDKGFAWTPVGEATGASASGLGSTAMGDKAVAHSYDTAVGYGATVDADGSVAIGANSKVASGAEGGTAIGQNAQVAAGANGSVALGEDSVASEANTVSVGSDANQRRITNVANGVGSFDAANMYQLNQTAANFQTQLDQAVVDINRRIDNVDDRVDDVGAMGAAFSALVPNPRVTGSTHFSLGVGAYDGSSAAAAGLFHFIDDCTLVNVGVAHGFRDGQTAARAGISIGW